MVAYIVTKNKGYFVLFLTAAAANFLNVSASFVSQYDGVEITPPMYKFISVLAIVTALGAIAIATKTAFTDKAFKVTATFRRWLPVAMLCLFYGMFAFFRLGATESPQTFWQANRAGEWFVYSLPMVSARLLPERWPLRHCLRF